MDLSMLPRLINTSRIPVDHKGRSIGQPDGDLRRQTAHLTVIQDKDSVRGMQDDYEKNVNYVGFAYDYGQYPKIVAVHSHPPKDRPQIHSPAMSRESEVSRLKDVPQIDLSSPPQKGHSLLRDAPGMELSSPRHKNVSSSQPPCLQRARLHPDHQIIQHMLHNRIPRANAFGVDSARFADSQHFQRMNVLPHLGPAFLQRQQNLFIAMQMRQNLQPIFNPNGYWTAPIENNYHPSQMPNNISFPSILPPSFRGHRNEYRDIGDSSPPLKRQKRANEVPLSYSSVPQDFNSRFPLSHPAFPTQFSAHHFSDVKTHFAPETMYTPPTPEPPPLPPTPEAISMPPTPESMTMPPSLPFTYQRPGYQQETGLIRVPSESSLPVSQSFDLQGSQITSGLPHQPSLPNGANDRHGFPFYENPLRHPISPDLNNQMADETSSDASRNKRPESIAYDANCKTQKKGSAVRLEGSEYSNSNLTVSPSESISLKIVTHLTAREKKYDDFSRLLLLENKFELLETLKWAADMNRESLVLVVERLLSQKLIANALILLDNLKKIDLTERAKEKIFSIIQEKVWGYAPRLELWKKAQIEATKDGNTHDPEEGVAEDSEKWALKESENHLDANEHGGNDNNEHSKTEESSGERCPRNVESLSNGLYGFGKTCAKTDGESTRQRAVDDQVSVESDKVSTGNCTVSNENCANASQIPAASSPGSVNTGHGTHEAMKGSSYKEQIVVLEDSRKINDSKLSLPETCDECVQVEDSDDICIKEEPISESEDYCVETTENLDRTVELDNGYQISEKEQRRIEEIEREYEELVKRIGILKETQLEVLGKVTVFLDASGNIEIKEETEESERTESCGGDLELKQGKYSDEGKKDWWNVKIKEEAGVPVMKDSNNNKNENLFDQSKHS